MYFRNLFILKFCEGTPSRTIHRFRVLSSGFLELRKLCSDYKIRSRFHSNGFCARNIIFVGLLALLQISCGGGGGGNETANDSISPDIQEQPAIITENEPAPPIFIEDANIDESPSFASIEAELANLEDRGVIPRLDTGTTVEGTDADDNGIRDDIEAFIDFLPITETQKDASLSYARSFQQELLVDLDDEVEINLTIQNTMEAMKCLQSRSPERWQDLVDAISNVSLNTEERITRYLTYSEAVSRSVIRLPSGNTCEQ